MYKRLSELIVRVADLCEAEGRLLRKVAARLGLGFSLMAVAALLVFVGVALLLGAIWIAANQSLGPAWASAITGLVTLVIASVLLFVAGKLSA